MFCFTAGVMVENIATHSSDIWAASEAAFARHKKRQRDAF